MNKKIDIPGVSGGAENLINDISSAWQETSKWAIPTAFFLIATMVAWEVIKKRLKRRV